MPNVPAAEARLSSLDVLRGIAVLLVFNRHVGLVPVLPHSGWMGVDLFFVLSGFLVSGLLFREYREKGRVAPGRFLLRRAFKIYPQFYILVAVTVAGYAVTATPLRMDEFIAEVLFVQNYHFGLWAHTWSLAVEEHFYLLLALAVWWLVRRRGARAFSQLPAAIAAILAIVLALRGLTAWADPRRLETVHLFPSHLRLDSLLAGVLLAYYFHFEPERLRGLVARWRGWLSPVSVLCLTPAAFLDQQDPWMYTLGFTSIYAGFAILLLLVLYQPPKPGGAGRIASGLAWLGRISYGTYLWHGPVLLICDRTWPRLGLGDVPLLPGVTALVLTIVAGHVSTWLIETPFLRLRDRWVPRAGQDSAAVLSAVTRP